MTKGEILRKYFGHAGFRRGQDELVEAILGGRDCLGVMPTGAGKSVCFQLPALMLSGTTVVISPLISLMHDQVNALVENGIPAGCINSGESDAAMFETIQRASSGELKILYVAPERLETESFLRLCEGIKIPLVAVDEAHCVSHWGQDFRPSYLKISGFIASLKKRPVVAAFTATATDVVKNDIIKILGLRSPLSITTGFDRPNLYFEVREPKNKNEELLSILKSSSGSAIVYCGTRKNVENVCEILINNDINAAMYHAGFNSVARKTAQDDFIYDKADVIVATNAFGMGIDKSNVSLVVHYNMPKDLESYYQEAGRAGRDGAPARCILLYNASDERLARFMIDKSHADSELSEKEQEALRVRDVKRLSKMLQYCHTTNCRRAYILDYFGEEAENGCQNCDNCTKGFETVDITVEAQKVLSCIFRLKQRNRALGKVLVRRILLGSRDKRILENGLDSLSTYGIMREYNAKYLNEIINFLEIEGYFEVCGEMGVCVLTPKADEFIKNKGTIMMRRRAAAAEKREPRVKRSAAERLPNQSASLFEQLRAARRELAEALGVPPYIVFSDATLIDMCVVLPRTFEQFLEVSGVGQRKAERYGRKFLSVINNYLEEREL